MRTVIKDPDEEVIWGFNWSDRMAQGERISSSTWTIPAGITGANAVYEAQKTQVEIQGGTSGTQYKIVNEVATTGGEVFKRSFYVLVRDR